MLSGLQLCAIHGKRITIMNKDSQFLRGLMNIIDATHPLATSLTGGTVDTRTRTSQLTRGIIANAQRIARHNRINRDRRSGSNGDGGDGNDGDEGDGNNRGEGSSGDEDGRDSNDEDGSEVSGDAGFRAWYEEGELSS